MSTDDAPPSVISVLDDFFGSQFGPDELSALLSFDHSELSRFFLRLQQFYYVSCLQFDWFRPAEGRYCAFPIVHNYRDVAALCRYTRSRRPVGEATTLAAEIARLLLYYDKVVLVDPFSLAVSEAIFSSGLHDGDIVENQLRLALFNSGELLVALSPYLRRGDVALYPQHVILRRASFPVIADVDKPEFRRLVEAAGYKADPDGVPRFDGSIFELLQIGPALMDADIDYNSANILACLLNSYLVISVMLNSTFVAQTDLTWQYVQYKTRTSSEMALGNIAEGIVRFSTAATTDIIDLVDFDDLTPKELLAIRSNHDAFAAWRADLNSLIQFAERSKSDYATLVLEVARLAAELLPRRAAEIRQSLAKGTLSNHVRAAATAFGTAVVAGLVTTGNWADVVNRGLATSAAGLAASLLFGGTKTSERVMLKLYTMLTHRGVA